MARQKGHIKYVGTLGEVRHFKIKGNEGYFVGLKGGPTVEQVKTAPGFIRTRKNMSEFTACANAGKSVRIRLSSLMKQMSDSQLAGRLTAIMKKISIEAGSEARGQRAVLVPQYKKMVFWCWVSRILRCKYYRLFFNSTFFFNYQHNC